MGLSLGQRGLVLGQRGSVGLVLAQRGPARLSGYGPWVTRYELWVSGAKFGSAGLIFANKIGHYHADCQEEGSCGYCQGDDHLSEQCPIREQKDHAKFKCVNCKEAGKDFEGHSSHYHKCPTLLEAQKKTKQNLPYYAKNQN